AREAMRIAELGTDPWHPASLRASMSHLLLTQGRFGEAYRVAVAAAESIEPGAREELPRMSLYGALLLRGATAAARYGDATTAEPLLAEAGDIARHVGDRNVYSCAFGSDYVIMQTVDVRVVTEAYPLALASARNIPRDTPLPLACRLRHLQDRALAHTRLR